MLDGVDIREVKQQELREKAWICSAEGSSVLGRYRI